MPELKFGLTAPLPCSYLPNEDEQLVFLLPEQPLSPKLYQQLLALNFRRSGEQVYTPHCPDCSACQSVRINPIDFSPSRSQRRLLNKAQRNELTHKFVDKPSADYFPLFADYITYKHADGSMFPPSREQLNTMLNCSWMKLHFLEQYRQQQLVAVTIVDTTSDAYSAVYSFFHPSVSALSPGILAVLYLLQCAQQNQKQWLYLGYQINECQKMAYKAVFRPQQRFIQGQWHSFG